MSRRLALALAAAALATPSGAHAAVTPFGALACTTPDGPAGARYCGGDPGPAKRTLVASFDGVPLDVNVALPPASAGDGPFPLIVIAHGWGGQKNSFADTGSEGTYIGTLRALATRGYAVLSATARGFNGSCGTPGDRAANAAACANGFIRLDDYRFEAMDIAYLAGRLVDEGIARPAIGVGGESYGGGVSLELAVLKDRMCDDLYSKTAHSCQRLVPWTSPGGVPMRIAAATPIIPWSDLVYSLAPNGRTLDYTLTNPYVDGKAPGDDAAVLGVEKQSYVAGLYALGNARGYYQTTPAQDTSDRKADLTTWFARLNAGEPYDGDPAVAEIVDLIARFRSPYNMALPAGGPAPLLISNGWTDDLFPVDEALRFSNRVLAQSPDASIALLFANHGHSRGANGKADLATIRERVQAMFERYVKGDAAVAAPSGVEAYLSACPAPSKTASPGPITAPRWPALHPGEVRFAALPAVASAPQGDPREDKVADPIANSDPCASVSGPEDPAGTAAYRLPQVTGSGYTLLGAPTVVARLALAGGPAAQVVGRLWDVAPDGSEVLVAQGVYRPLGRGTEVFQLHANAWRFAAGHTPRLELLGSGAPYVRRSNGAASVTVSDLQLRLPVREEADCRQVLSPAAPVLPSPDSGLSRMLAPGVAATGAGPCSSAAQTSAGATPGSVGGQPLDRTGNVAGSATRGKRIRVRVVFGPRRDRAWGGTRRRGIVVRVSCSARCRATTRLKYGLLMVGSARRVAGGRFAVRTRPTRRGLRRLSHRHASRVRLVVTVTTPAGRRLRQRTGGFVIRPPARR